MMTGAQAREETGAGGADPGGEREGRDGGVFLTVAVGRLARELTVQADREMSGLNVTVTRYTVLEALVTARALSAAEVARAVGLTPQTVSPVIREMARCEWVTRSLGGLRGRGGPVGGHAAGAAGVPGGACAAGGDGGAVRGDVRGAGRDAGGVVWGAGGAGGAAGAGGLSELWGRGG